MSNRIDLYKEIHKGLRLKLTQLLNDAACLDVMDDKSVKSFNSELIALFSMLEEHASHEDLWLQPLIQLHDPGLAGTTAVEHIELDKKMALVTTSYQSLSDTLVGERTHRGHFAYLHLAHFVASYLQHMHHEEMLVLTVLQDAYSDEDLLEVHQKLRSSVAPERMGDYLAAIIPSLNITERTEMLGGMQKFAPREVFEGVCNLAKQVLAPADWQQLKVRLSL